MKKLKQAITAAILEPNQQVTIFYDRMPARVIRDTVVSTINDYADKICEATVMSNFRFELIHAAKYIRIVELGTVITFDRYQYKSLLGVKPDSVISVDLDKSNVLDIECRTNQLPNAKLYVCHY